ncbi:hypothetical protein [uncultured Roseobacter sp.]|uniref:hypothetical protein n=1 Tax=uncultured Roseobacter sp. TaxID=114847 RepID=UPI00260C4A75|nr:hypothetical protein [uncultured Roseobacter sp.]
MRILIADAEIDFDAAAVRRAGRLQPLPEAAARILRSLFDAEGAPVASTTLEAVIAGLQDRMQVGDAIGCLRELLGDGHDAERLIGTAGTSGYRLKVPARAVDGRPDRARDPACLLMFPLRLIGGDRNDQLIADGVTDLIAGHLMQSENVRLLSRPTAEAASGSDPDYAALENRTGVEFITEGSLMHQPAGYRLRVRLVRARHSSIIKTIQADSDASVGGLAEAARHISRMILRHNGIAGSGLPDTSGETRSCPGYGSLAAFRWAAAARASYRSGDIASARALLSEYAGVACNSDDDPGVCATASLLYLSLLRQAVFDDPHSISGKARRAAARAVAADPACASGQAALAQCEALTGDREACDASAQVAVSLAPRDPVVLAETGYAYALIGQEAEAVSLLEKAVSLSMVHPAWYNYAKIWQYVRLGYADKALGLLRAYPDPDSAWYLAQEVSILGILGETEKAMVSHKKLKHMCRGSDGIISAHLNHWQHNTELTGLFLKGWQAAGLNRA